MNDMTPISDEDFAKAIADVHLSGAQVPPREASQSLAILHEQVVALSVIVSGLSGTVMEASARVAAVEAERDAGSETSHAERAEYLEIIAKLRKALKPFANCAQLFPDLRPGEPDQPVYAAAAGREFTIYGEDLRNARQAYESSEID